jgi:outer membrane protein TolC
MNLALVLCSALVAATAASGMAADGPSAAVALVDDPAAAALVRDALERNPDLARARATVEAERDRVPQVGSLPDPTLTLGIQNDGFQSIQIGKMETSYWQVMATQPIPWPGKLGAREDVARAQVSSAEAQIERIRLTTVAEVERAYLELLRVRGQLELLAKQEALWKEAEVAVRTRYEVGQAIQSDLLRSQLERTRLQRRRVALEAEERTRVQALNTLRVRPLDEPVATPRGLAALADPPLRSAEEAAADAERRSPDLLLARTALAAAERRVDSAKKDWFPDMYVTASVMPRGAIEPMWALQIGFTLPVFGASKQSKGVAEAVSRREADAQGEGALRLQVLLRAEERRTLLASTLETIRLYRGGLLVQSDAAVRSTLSQYQVGRASFPSVLEVLRGLVVDESGYLDALADAQRIGVGDREVSLAPVGAGGGGLGGGSIPGAGAVASGGRGGGSSGSAPEQPAAGGGGMPSGM